MKKIEIEIVNDDVYEDEEFFSVRLSNLINASLESSLKPPRQSRRDSRKSSRSKSRSLYCTSSNINF